MAQFNLNDYETVEERLKRFWALPENVDARITTVNHTTAADRAVNMWVVETRIYLNRQDQLDDLPKATGWAFEIDGVGMANKTSGLENCETSSIGRCLGNMNMSGNKRTSREEMQKVERGVTPATNAFVWDKSNDKDRLKFVSAIANATDKDALRVLWTENVAKLDAEFVNSLGEVVTLKQLILSRQSELQG